MDEPIYYRLGTISRRTKVNLMGWIDGFPRYVHLYHATIEDDKRGFLGICRNYPEIARDFKAVNIFRSDAVRIASAVLNGRTNGVIDFENVLEDENGMTPLHLAALHRAPRLTKYLVESGGFNDVDATCHYRRLNLKQVTPLDLILQSIGYDGPRRSIFELLWRLCFLKTDRLEMLRMLIQNTQNMERVRQTFIDYANKGELLQLGALFLAAPELFLSSPTGGLSTFVKLYQELNSLESPTDIQLQLLLLLDVFSLVGDKFAAYIRLLETSEHSQDLLQLEVDCFLREAACKKFGVFSLDYYLRFFERVIEEAVGRRHWNPALQNLDSISDFPEYTGTTNIYSMLPYVLPYPIDESDMPSLDPEDADRLTRAIEKKLSSISTRAKANLEVNAKISNKGEKHLPLVSFFHSVRSIDPTYPSVRSFDTSLASEKLELVPCVRSIDPGARLFHTCPSTAKSGFGSKFTQGLEKKAMKPNFLKSLVGKLSHFPVIAKRLIK